MGRIMCSVCKQTYSDINVHELTKIHIDAANRNKPARQAAAMNGPRPRCAIGLGYDGLATRCYLPAGHSGPHKAKDRKTNPYVTIRWFSGDTRSFLTTRSAAWAWKDTRREA